MAELFDFVERQERELRGRRGEYLDRQFFRSLREQQDAKDQSSTVYVGNLSFFSTDQQIYHLFTKIGCVKKVILGLNNKTKRPCGFAFVEFFTRIHAQNAVDFLNGTHLDGKLLKVELDFGFREGRQYGRAKFGGQLSDERRVKRRRYEDKQRPVELDTE